MESWSTPKSLTSFLPVRRPWHSEEGVCGLEEEGKTARAWGPYPDDVAGDVSGGGDVPVISSLSICDDDKHLGSISPGTRLFFEHVRPVYQGRGM